MREIKTGLEDSHVIELVARIVLVGLLVYGSYLILQPFIGIIIWSIIIAVAINPLITLGEKRLGWSRTKVSVYFTVAVVAPYPNSGDWSCSDAIRYRSINPCRIESRNTLYPSSE